MIEDIIQEEQYSFPYHHLIEINKDYITFKKFTYGLEYFSYFNVIKNNIIKLKPQSLIDIGCGDGKLIYELCRNHQFYNRINRIVGIDKDKKAITYAKAFNKFEKPKFYVDNILNFNSEGCDIGILMEVIEHFSDKDLNDLIQKIGELISLNGLLIVSVPSKNLKLQPKHYRHYCKRDLLNLFNKNFRIQNFYFIYPKSFINKLMVKIYLISDVLDLVTFKKKIFSLFKSNYLYTSESKCSHIVAIFKRIKET